MRLNRVAVIALAAGSFAASASAHNEVVIGHSASGQLVAHIDFAMPLPLEVSTFPGLPYWWSGATGVSSAEIDEPAEDLFVLSDTADIRIVFAGADPFMVMYNGLTQMNVGDSYIIGAPVFHVHPVFGRTEGEIGATGSVRFYMHDASGQYTDSAIAQLDYETVPAPGVMFAGVAGAVAMAARRRRPA